MVWIHPNKKKRYLCSAKLLFRIRSYPKSTTPPKRSPQKLVTNQVTGLEPSKVCLRRVLPEKVFTHEVQLIYSHVLVLELRQKCVRKSRSIAFKGSWGPLKTPAKNSLRFAKSLVDLLENPNFRFSSNWKVRFEK